MKQIDYEYFEWLVSQVDVPKHKTLNDLFERMHNWEFRWLVTGDDNRRQDGLDLRSEFLDGSNEKLSLQEPTLLEILISLSQRVAFTAGGGARHWAWRLLKNLQLNKSVDPLSDEEIQRVDEILYSLIWRTYEPSGRGGFFPLQNPPEDQTKVEIWYQMNAYVIEMKSR